MSTATDNPSEQISAFWLRGDPGNFTEIMPAAQMDQLMAAQSRELREQAIVAGTGKYILPARVLPGRRWWEYYAHSAAHSACCDAKARDIVGGSFTIEPGRQPVADALIERMSELILGSQEALNDACRDWEATGWCDLECLPTRSGRELAALNHIDSWTVYPVKDDEGFVHMRDMRLVWYSPLGQLEPDAYQLAHLNNNHWWNSTYYGVPDIMSAIIQIESSYEALKHNQEYFARRGGYRWLLLFKDATPVGAPSDTETAKLIQKINYEVVKSGRESTSDIFMVPIGKREAVIQRLDSDMKDMDFPALLESYRNTILMRHGVPPLRAGIVESGALGGNVGQEQLRSYSENVVLPKQQRWGRFITSILRAWFGVDVTFTWNPIEQDAFAATMQSVVMGFQSSLISQQEGRIKLGLPADMEPDAILYDELSSSSPFGPVPPGQPQ